MGRGRLGGMRRALVLLAMIAFVASACADERPSLSGGPSPVETSAEPTPTPTGDDLAGASCKDQQGGDPANNPDFTEVRVEDEPEQGTEKVEFRFEPKKGSAEAPLWFAGFVPQLITDGEGAPVDALGEAFVSVSFMARGVDLSGETFEPIYTGPTEFTDTGLSTVLEVEQTGDFEGLVSWGIGLSHEACFVVDARPDRLILEFPVTP